MSYYWCNLHNTPLCSKTQLVNGFYHIKTHSPPKPDETVDVQVQYLDRVCWERQLILYELYLVIFISWPLNRSVRAKHRSSCPLEMAVPSCPCPAGVSSVRREQHLSRQQWKGANPSLQPMHPSESSHLLSFIQLLCQTVSNLIRVAMSKPCLGRR